MAEKKIFWTDAEKKALPLIKEHKKAFLRKCAVGVHNNQLYTSGATTGWQYDVRIRHLNSNPNLGSALLNIGRAIHNIFQFENNWPPMKPFERVNFFEKLYQRYWERILAKHEILSGKGKVEYATATDQMRELLQRGFISHQDVLGLEKGKWVVTDALKLAWPKDFTTQAEAQDIVNRFGLIGTIKMQVVKDNQTLK